MHLFFPPKAIPFTNCYLVIQITSSHLKLPIQTSHSVLSTVKGATNIKYNFKFLIINPLCVSKRLLNLRLTKKQFINLTQKKYESKSTKYNLNAVFISLLQ